MVELFEKVLEGTLDFKEDIFFKNLTHTAKNVANMDNKKIPHNFKEIETSELVRKIENAGDLMNKYTNKAKTLVEEE